MKLSFRLGVYKNWRGVWGVSKGKLERELVTPYLSTDEHVCPQLIKDTLYEAKKNFPIHFKMDVCSGGEYIVETDSFTEQIIEHTYPKSLPLPRYKSNTFIIDEEVIDWFLEYFGGNK